MTELWRDLQFGVRMLARNKGFTAVALAVLALGIGPNVAIFSVIYAIFVAPMPYPQANQLVLVWNNAKGQRTPMLADEYLQFQAHNKSFEFLGFGSWSIKPQITGPDHVAEDISGMALTPGEYTRGYGLRMAMGRDFLPSEGTPGSDREIIISHKLWQERYNSDRAIVGKTIMVNDQPSEIVGVVAAGIADRNGMDFIVPAAFQPVGGNRGHVGNVMGRLKPGITLAQAQAELAVIDRQFVSMNTRETPNDGWNISVEPLRNAYLSKKIARNLRVLFAAVGLVLLIACSNLANLLLARGSSRQQEIAVRAALGASPTRVFRQLIAESLLLATAGGAGGVLLGWAMMRIALLLLPPDFSLQAEVPIAMNVPVMCFAVGTALFAGVLSGCIPAWHSAKLNLSEVLKLGSRSVTGRGRRRTQAMLVIAEFALALTLLAGAGMVLHSFWNLTHIDIGARTDHILTAWIQAPRSEPWNPDRSKADLHTMIEKIDAVPGVVSVALASAVPMQGFDAHHFSIAGGPENSNESQVADFEIVTPSYFETFGVQLLKGRLLSDADRAGSPRAIVVSDSFVDRYLQGVDPLEQRLLLPLNLPGEKVKTQTSWQIVGVFRGVLNSEHLVDKASPEMFVPLWQSPFGWAGELAVHTSSEPGTVTRSIRAAITKALPGYALVSMQDMQDWSEQGALDGDRFGAVLFAGFATLALLLAAIGIYGVMSFTVAQRTPEIALRMALGARRGDVVRMIMADGMKLAIAGSAVGLAGVVLEGRLLRSALYGVSMVDAGNFIAVASLLMGVAVLATYLPARRSATIDPILNLRSD